MGGVARRLGTPVLRCEAAGQQAAVSGHCPPVQAGGDEDPDQGRGRERAEMLREGTEQLCGHQVTMPLSTRDTPLPSLLAVHLGPKD